MDTMPECLSVALCLSVGSGLNGTTISYAVVKYGGCLVLYSDSPQCTEHSPIAFVFLSEPKS